MSVVVIDPATGGVAGLYLDAYAKAASTREVTMVGAYASLSNAPMERYFYKRTDLASGGRQRFGKLRMPLRYMELIQGLIRSLLLIIRTRPKAVFYALSSNLMPELLFVLTLRLFRIPIHVICHDVVPFVGARENRALKDAQRRQFYRFANRLICHNRRSLVELRDRYGIAADKLDYLPFPLMDIRPLAQQRTTQTERSRLSVTRVRFLFIGHMRPEKGVNLLIHAWRKAASRLQGSELVIAGQVPAGERIVSNDGIPRLTILDDYIDEQRYVHLIDEADVVVLPYLAGTNSGVLSNVVSLGKLVIVSDIAMFPESGLIDDTSTFAAGEVDALVDRLVEYGSMSAAQRRSKAEAVERIRDHRMELFSFAFDAILHRITPAG
ncbi:glycosyltransferase family 4 protein [Sphingomonas hankookensis]|uniref:glycosyltransferase family 4 protein n=1 Tax=Sphingomonas hankookensis TaxID=563996 RepID=UPI00234F2263|nr:glycosyltransferase family 4 protein [Sphingomonas hankookensis]WCP73939.1 glycosyltransferase family 4 protein [Sphingomonas hankookensis]